MNKNQKIFVICTVIILLSGIGYSTYSSYQQEKEAEGKLDVVTTFYPLTYFTENIGGEHVSVETLVPYNNEIHSWQPSPSDILSADEADVLIYNGAEADSWFEDDILPAIKKSDKLIIETTADIELQNLDEGSEHEEEGEEANGDHDHDHGEFDPHTWISPYISKQQAEAIYKALIKEDPEHEADYTANWNELKSQFEQMDKDYQHYLDNKTKETIIITHAAFGYIADRYDFEQEGVIGLSADEQPSTSTIAALVDLMDDHGIYVVYIDPVYSDEYAKTIKNEVEEQSGVEVTILKLYFMMGPIDGLDYFEQQEANLENLRIGLRVP
jgi:zinc transport system substrate-binding protein